MDLVYATFSPWKSGSEKLPMSAVSRPVLQETGPIRRAVFLEPIRPRRASNFYYGHCKKQAQTLTVRYAKLSPGLRNRIFRNIFLWPLAAVFREFWHCLRYSASFEERFNKAGAFRSWQMPMKLLQLCRERIETSPILAPQVNQTRGRN
jgi:hypothetical protein